MSIFDGHCRFVLSAPTPQALPKPEYPEVAFVGRSNVGKSSLINALTGQKALARTSVTPGRTQAINFFLQDETLMLVDLPGYGFAKAPPQVKKAWMGMMKAYLRKRTSLRRVALLIDSRRGLMDSDHEMMDLLDDAAVSYQIVLTKADKLSARELAEVQEQVKKDASRHSAVYPEMLVTSAEKGDGLRPLRNALAQLAAKS